MSDLYNLLGEDDDEQGPQQSSLPMVDPLADLRAPDEIAQERRIADEVGEPPAAIRAYPELFSQRAEAQQRQRATEGSPRLRAWLERDGNAEIARDDLANLTPIERWWRQGVRAAFGRASRYEQYGNQGDYAAALSIPNDAVGAFTYSGARILAGSATGDVFANEQARQGELDVEYGRLAYRAQQEARGWDALSAEDRTRLEELATREGQHDWGPFILGPTRRLLPQRIGSFQRAGEQAAVRAGEVWENPFPGMVLAPGGPNGGLQLITTPSERSDARRVLDGLTTAVVQAPAAAVATVGGAGGGYLSFGYEMETGIAYDQMIRSGIEPSIAAERAEQYGAWATAIEFVGETLGFKISGMGRLATRGVLGERALATPGSSATGRAMQAVLGTAADQGAEEAAQEYAQIIHQDLARQDQENPGGESRVRWAEVLTPESIQQILMAGYIGAQGGAGMAAIPAGANFALDTAAAQRAERNAQVFEEMTRAAQQSLVAQRLPSAFESAVAAATDNSAVYIDADRFVEHFQSAGVSPYAVADELGVGSQRLAEALSSHGQVEIPTGVFAARVLRIPTHAPLANHARISPTDATPAEIENANEVFRAEVERIAQETDAVANDNDMGAFVESKIRELFQAAEQVGGPRPEVARRYAQLAAALPRAMVARARAVDPAYADRLEQQFRQLFGERFDIAGPGRDGGFEGATQLDQRPNGPDAAPTRNDRYDPPEGVRMSEKMRKIVEMAVNGASNDWIAEEMGIEPGNVRVTLTQAKGKLGGQAPWEAGVSSVPAGRNPRTGETTWTDRQLAAMYDALVRAGYSNKAGPGGDNINTIISRRTGINRKTVASRLSKYREKQRRASRGTEGEVNGDGAGRRNGTSGELNQFAGERSLGYDEERLLRAEEMEDLGYTPSEIWVETGWWRNPADKKWRYEIDDSKVQFVNAVALETRGADEGTLAEVLRFPELFAAYPQLAGLGVGLEVDAAQTAGAYDEENKVIVASGPDLPSIMSALLHEVQHAIQTIEGFANGGSLGGAKEYVFEYLDAIEAVRNEVIAKHFQDREHYNRLAPADSEWVEGAIAEEAAVRVYLRIAGEIEARNVQRRRGEYMRSEFKLTAEPRVEPARRLSVEERKTTDPSQTVDVPLESAILPFDFQDGGRLVALRSVAREAGSEIGRALGRPPRRSRKAGGSGETVRSEGQAPTRESRAPRPGKTLDEIAAEVAGRLEQGQARGSIRYENFRSGEFGSAMIRMGKASDLSTFLHEFGHLGHLVLESIAGDEQAPAEFKAMWENTLQWWGLSQEQWAALSTEQKTPYFERWARTFEAYLMEGKAPSFSLREAFAAFKAWLTQIYRSVFRLDANLNPQIRDVFDRMLATDAEMAEARAAMGSDFTLAREAFKTDEEFQQYTQAISDARDAQDAELRARVMDRFVRKEKRWWRSERERVRTTAEIEVDSDPARRAFEWLAFKEWRALPVEQNEEGVELPQDASLQMPEGLPDMRLDMSTLDEADRAGLPVELRPLANEADADAALENAMALKRQGRARQPQRLWSFIKAQGGIKDEGGEVTQALGSARSRPGLINNTSGLSADELALRAWEAGYFGAVPRQNQLNQFAGWRAATANMDTLQLAKEMERAGKDRGFIWQHSGWARGLDGEWRFEIPSEDLRVIRPLNQVARRKTAITVGEVIDWPSLFAAYPHLENIEIEFTSDKTEGGSYWHRDGGNAIIFITRGHNSAALLSVLRHELQHAIQRFEGFAEGYNPDSVTRGSARWKKAVQVRLSHSEQWRKHKRGTAEPTADDIREAEAGAAFAVYANEMGEIEARDVQNRARSQWSGRRGDYRSWPMSPEERAAVPPNDAFDIYRDPELTWRAPRSRADSAVPRQTLFQGDGPDAGQSGAGQNWVDVSHGTYANIEGDFSPGSHFGTERAARRILRDVAEDTPRGIDTSGGGRVMQAQVRGPFVRTADMETGWDSPRAWLDMAEDGARGGIPSRGSIAGAEVSEAERAFWRSVRDDPQIQALSEQRRGPDTQRALNERLSQILERHGFSNFSYQNAYEGGTSYYAPNPANVRRANAPDGGASGAGNRQSRFTQVSDDPYSREYEVQIDDGAMARVRIQRSDAGDDVQWDIEARQDGGVPATGPRRNMLGLSAMRGVREVLAHDAQRYRPQRYTFEAASDISGDTSGRGNLYRSMIERDAEALGYSPSQQGPFFALERRAPDAPNAGSSGGSGEMFQSETVRRRVIDTDRGPVIINPNRSDMLRMTRVPLGQRDKAWMYDSVRYIIDRDGNVFVGPGANMIHDEIASAAEGAGFKVEGYQYGDSYGHGAGVETGSFRRIGEAFTFDDIRNPSRMGNPVELFQDETADTQGRRPTPRELLDALIDDIKNVRQVYSSKDEAAVAAYQNRADAIRWFEARGIDLSGSKEEIRAQIAEALQREQEEAGGGWHPDDIAPWFGFSSGDELIQAMRGLKPRAVAIEENIDARLEGQYGDPLRDGTVAEAAALAGHIEAQSKRIEIELVAIQRATGGKATPVGRAARAYAERQVQSMTVKQIRNFDTFLAGERRAARAAMEATQKKDFQTAALMKQRQLVSFWLYRAARDAAEHMDRIQSRWQRYTKSAGARAAIGARHIEQIDAILDTIETGKPSYRPNQTLDEWAADLASEGNEDLLVFNPAVVAEQIRRPLSQMDYADVQAVDDVLRNIETIGRGMIRLRREKEAQRIADIQQGLRERIQQEWGNKLARRLSLVAPDAPTKAGLEFRHIHAQLLKMDYLARLLDGLKDGGPWMALMAQVQDAENDLHSRSQAASQQFLQIVRNHYTPAQFRRMLDKRVYIDAIEDNRTKAQIIGLALNMGNEYNREALLRGERWTPEQLRQVLDKLDRNDWAFVQALWNYVGQWKEESFALDERTRGSRPAEVIAAPFTLPDGTTIAGGYWPVAFDLNRSDRAAARDARETVIGEYGGAFRQAATNRGRLKGRVGTGGQALSDDFMGVLAKHVHDSLRDITHRELIITLRKVKADKELRSMIARVAGRDAVRALDEWTHRLAARMPANAFGDYGRLPAYLRRAGTAHAMGFKVSVAALNLLGHLQAIPRNGVIAQMKQAGISVAVGFPDLLRRHLQAIVMRRDAEVSARVALVYEKSEMMRQRRNTFDRDIAEVKGDLVGRREGAVMPKQIEDTLQILNAYTDQVVSVPTWLAAYESALDGKVKGVTGEEASVAYADSVVRMAISAGATKDLSALIASNNQWQRLFTMFMGWANTFYNQMATEQIPGVASGKISVPRFAANMVWIWLLPAVITILFYGQNERRDDEDEFEYWMRMIMTGVVYPLQTIPLVRDLLSAIVQGYKPQTPISSVIDRSQKLASAIERGDQRQMVKQGFLLAGQLTGAPSQLYVTGDFAADVAAGEEQLPWNSDDPADSLAEMLLRDTR